MRSPHRFRQEENHMSNHGCNKYKKHDWPIEKIRHWIEIEKRTHKWVANQINCGNQHVSRICKKHGIKSQPCGNRLGPDHPEWKGGEIIDKDGYCLVYCPGHPNARKPREKYVLKHRLVMENHIGRYLERDEVVHHKKARSDNRIENLVLYSANSEHLKGELKGKIPNWTDAGRQRTLDGVQRWRDSRKALKCDALQMQ
ncbi:MAG TPA: hypothetical protein ENH65_03180 [Candidatus Aminicenantes bacterium]|nr:hypothetical protein [Candidatus Aminicenantes bacterium]